MKQFDITFRTIVHASSLYHAQNHLLVMLNRCVQEQDIKCFEIYDDTEIQYSPVPVKPAKQKQSNQLEFSFA